MVNTPPPAGARRSPLIPILIALLAAMGFHLEYPVFKGFNFNGGINVAHAFTALTIALKTLGALMIYNIFFSVALICLSGYLMTTDMFWGEEWVEELHEAAVNWVEFSVVLHVAAVLFESLRTKVNLPRAMVTGYKEIP